MNKLIGLTVVLILVIFLFVYTNSQKSQGLFFGINKTISPTISPSNSPVAQDSLTTDVIPLSIGHGKIASGSKFQIHSSHMVVLQITSDEPGAFYLEGYDKHVFLQKGKMVVLSFLSIINGRFDYELSNLHKVIGTIIVAK